MDNKIKLILLKLIHTVIMHPFNTCELCNLFQKLCNTFRGGSHHLCDVIKHSPSKK